MAYLYEYLGNGTATIYVNGKGYVLSKLLNNVPSRIQLEELDRTAEEEGIVSITEIKEKKIKKTKKMEEE